MREARINRLRLALGAPLLGEQTVSDGVHELAVDVYVVPETVLLLEAERFEQSPRGLVRRVSTGDDLVSPASSNA